MKKDQTKFDRSISACLENAERLLEDAQMLEFVKPPASKYYLSMIAQEECAKAFILYLCLHDIIPWDSCIWRATRDHRCKQLICLIIKHITPDLDSILQEIEAQKNGRTICLDMPLIICDAMNILRYDKIGRWKSNNWFWSEDPCYDREALAVSKGAMDDKKQDSLYIRIDKNGNVITTPERISEEDANAEHEKAYDFITHIKSLHRGDNEDSFDLARIKTSLSLLFSNYEE